MRRGARFGCWHEQRAREDGWRKWRAGLEQAQRTLLSPIRGTHPSTPHAYRAPRHAQRRRGLGQPQDAHGRECVARHGSEGPTSPSAACRRHQRGRCRPHDAGRSTAFCRPPGGLRLCEHTHTHTHVHTCAALWEAHRCLACKKSAKKHRWSY